MTLISRKPQLQSLILHNFDFEAAEHASIHAILLRGVKWGDADKRPVYCIDGKNTIVEFMPNIKGMATIECVQHLCFNDLVDSDLENCHIKNVVNLRASLTKTLPGFNRREIVTLLTFKYYPNK